MRWIIIFAVFIVTLVAPPSRVLAQPMMSSTGSPQVGTQSAVSSDGHTAREEAEGKTIWEKLQAKQLECENLTSDNFEALGEYFMGQMLALNRSEASGSGVGSSHEAMNKIMVRMMGEEGEKQAHIALGKRNSGCGVGFIPMMGSGFGNMMSGGGGFGILGWLAMLIFWALLILGVAALIRYLARGEHGNGDKTPLDILKERYARGEIGKKEFEEMKGDLC